MNVNYSPKNELTDINNLSVAFTRTGKQGHAAILYTDTSNIERLLHFVGDKKLRQDDPSKDYIWFNIPLKDDLTKSLISLYCNTIYKQNERSIPYSFDSNGTGFDQEGNFFQTYVDTGLTCGTFVIKVLEENGITIINSKNWPIRKTDQKWQYFILGLLPFKFVEKLKIRIKNGINRYRPEEVVAAASMVNHPHSYDDIERNSLRIVKIFALYLKLRKPKK